MHNSIIIFILCPILLAIDYSTTYIVVFHLNGYELNPVVRMFLNNFEVYGLLIAYAIAVISYVVLYFIVTLIEKYICKIYLKHYVVKGMRSIVIEKIITYFKPSIFLMMVGLELVAIVNNVSIMLNNV